MKPTSARADAMIALFCTVSWAAEHIGVHTRSVRRYIDQGLLSRYTVAAAANDKPNVLLYRSEVELFAKAYQREVSALSNARRIRRPAST